MKPIRLAVPLALAAALGACSLGGLLGACLGLYGLLDATAPVWLGVPVLVLGLALHWATIDAGGQRVGGTLNAFDFPFTGGIAWLLTVASGVLAFLLAGRLVFGSEEVRLTDVDFAELGTRSALAREVQGFAWLRDLAASASRDKGARVAEAIAGRWLIAHGTRIDAAWAPDLWGERILHWTAYAPYILSSRDAGYRSALLNTLARGARHLEWSTAPDNHAAQRLYDSTGAERSEWVEYELEL